MRVVCTACSAEYSWVPTKGVRLSGYPCPACGGKVERRVKPRVVLVICGVCGRRRGGDKIAWPAVEFRADFGGVVLPAGTPCCSSHTLTTPDLTQRLTFVEKYPGDGG